MLEHGLVLLSSGAAVRERDVVEFDRATGSDEIDGSRPIDDLGRLVEDLVDASG